MSKEMVIGLRNGHVMHIPVTTFRLENDLLTGNIHRLHWTSPPDGVLLHFVNLSDVIYVLEQEADLP